MLLLLFPNFAVLHHLSWELSIDSETKTLLLLLQMQLNAVGVVVPAIFY
jgi:hypothetical protein